jgi:hypothetical protein
MEKWRRVWREGLAPNLSTVGLYALQSALVEDDPRLMQGVTCFPPPLEILADCEVGRACAVGYCGWQGEGLTRVEEVDEYFARLCDLADIALLEPAACRYFLNWFDETPREEMRRELLAEVNLALDSRVEVGAAA